MALSTFTRISGCVSLAVTHADMHESGEGGSRLGLFFEFGFEIVVAAANFMAHAAQELATC